MSGRASCMLGRNQFVGSRMIPRTWARAAGRACSAVKRVGVPAPVIVLYAMIPRDGLAGVECGAKGGARRDEKRISPRGDAGELTCPQDVLDSLATFAAGASALIENGPERVRADVPKDATAQQPSTVVSDRQQHRALLVVELG